MADALSGHMAELQAPVGGCAEDDQSMSSINVSLLLFLHPSPSLKIKNKSKIK